MSPGYPHKYQNEKECIYTITVAQNHIIKIMFSEFNLEHENNCDSDFLQIADSESEFSTEIGRFCGNLSNIQHTLLSNHGSIGNYENHTHTLYSTQNKMWVRQVSQKSGSQLVMLYYDAIFSHSDFIQIGI